MDSWRTISGRWIQAMLLGSVPFTIWSYCRMKRPGALEPRNAAGVGTVYSMVIL